MLNARPQLHTFFAIVVLALAYYLAAKLVFPLAAPPSNASAFWPSAGIALAFVLKFGRKVLPGVFLGSLLKNIAFFGLAPLASPINALLLFLIIPLLATFLAYLGHTLIQKYARYPDPLISEISTFKLLILGGPIAALLPAILSVTALVASNIMPDNGMLFSSFTWWLGDSLGIIIVTPLLLLFFDVPGKINANRKWVVAIPVGITFIVAVLLFQNSVNTEHQRLQTTLQHYATTLSLDIKHKIDTYTNFTKQMRDTIFIDDTVSIDDFNRSASAIRSILPDIQAIAWDVMVKGENRSQFEQQMQAIYQHDYQITTRNSQGDMQRSEDKNIYAAIAYISPYKNNEKALGFDPTSNPKASPFFYRARDTGEASMTSRLTLVQGNVEQVGIVTYLPVYKHGLPLDTIQQRQAAFIGNISSVYYLEKLISPALAKLNMPELILTITDISVPAQPTQLYSDISNTIAANNFTAHHTISVANRTWQINITPSTSYFKNNYSSNVWIILAIGMLFTAVITVTLIISTGRRSRIEEIVAERTDRLQKVQEDIRLLAVTFESHEAIMITDANNNILRVNKAFTTITGYPEEEVIGKNPRLLSSGRHHRSFYQEMWHQLKQNGKFEGEIWNRRKNGEVFPERQTISTVRDENDNIINYVSVFSDISTQKANENKIKDLAFYDPLTSLPNRRLLIDRLEYTLTLNQRNEQHGILLFLDLDNFKKINDSLGHEYGDLLLQQVAKRLQDTVRITDTVARLGGDEFVLLIANKSIENEALIDVASMLAEKIIETFSHPFDLKSYSHYISTSIGITIFPPTEKNATSVLRQADTAMYKAKNTGKNTFRFYETEMQKMAEASLALEHDLRLALKRNELSLHYQPQVNHDGHIISTEALLRWHHPTRGNVSPANFIPLAEDSGLIIPIGQWVLVEACTQLQSWLQQGNDMHHISVNVSPKQFRQDNFITQVQSALTQSGLAADKLMLEITEGVVLDNIDDTIKKMDTLKQMGIQFSIDDFGTGYSSLAYLKRLPINELKIDQSFVRDIATDQDDAEIVATIIAMATHLNLTVVAEGVETVQQLEFLINNGCTLFQGYYFSKPLSADDLLSFVQYTQT